MEDAQTEEGAPTGGQGAGGDLAQGDEQGSQGSGDESPGIPTTTKGGTVGDTAGVVTITKKGTYDELFTYLEEINGQDAYDATEAALGKLATTKYLRLPTDFVIPNIPAEKVGTSEAFGTISKDNQAKIYAMNKGAFTGDVAQVRGALLRMFLCAAGWLTPDSKYEVERAEPPKEWAKIMQDDLGKIKEVAVEAKRLAILLPIISEHVFRTMGHHYLTGQAAEFEGKYRRSFAACVEPTLSNYLAPEDLYHTASHWVSLARALAVVKDPVQATRLPNALVIRSNAPPAGTAIITTTMAVLAALEGTGLKGSYIAAAGVDEPTLARMAILVTKSPDVYHTIPSAYGKGALEPKQAEELLVAKNIAIKMAPIMQGFVDSLPRGCDLAAARALSKHADANPAMRMRAKRFFQETSRTKAGTISELLNMARRANILSASDIIGDEDLDE